MKTPARMATAIEILDIWQQTQKRLDILCGDFFRARRYIGSKDRAAISQTVYDIVRHYARLNWCVGQKMGNPTRHIMLAYLAMMQKNSSADIHDIFCGGTYAPHALSETEKKLLDHFLAKKFDDFKMPENYWLECPDWAFDTLKTSLAENFAAELLAQQHVASVDLRVNALKARRDDVLKDMIAAGYNATTIEKTDFGIRLSNRVAFGALSCLKDGRADVQDSASQQVAAMVGAAPGMLVLDLCAGAGGKTLAMAATMHNKGQIVACDISKKKLDELKRRARLAGAQNIQTFLLHELSQDYSTIPFAGKFDVVLIDAPCSGTGTWRRNPDARLTKPADWEKLHATQWQLLSAAFTLVKKDGHVVYATCSLAQCENADMTAAFTQSGNAALISQKQWLASADGTDGFYAARLAPVAIASFAESNG